MVIMIIEDLSYETGGVQWVDLFLINFQRNFCFFARKLFYKKLFYNNSKLAFFSSSSSFILLLRSIEITASINGFFKKLKIVMCVFKSKLVYFNCSSSIILVLSITVEYKISNEFSNVAKHSYNYHIQGQWLFLVVVYRLKLVLNQKDLFVCKSVCSRTCVSQNP